MRVVLLGPFPPPHGGVQTNLVAIRNYLRRQGHSCAVINITRYRKKEEDEVYYPESSVGLVQRLLTLKYDILHLHFGGNLTNRLLALSMVCCSIPGTRKVLTFHSGGYPSSPEGQTARPGTLRGFVLRRFDRLIGVNQEIVELYHRFGVSPSKTKFIFPYSFDVQASSMPEALENFFATHTPVLSTVGGLEPEYDLPTQIEAMRDILAVHPAAGLVIIGHGSIEREIRSLVASKPYADSILVCGDVPHSATLQVMIRCDVFLRTTLYDGDSVSVREALNYGTPVIATDNGMRPPGPRLVPIQDAEAVKRTVLECLQEPRKQRIVAGGSGEENLEAVVELYRDALAS